jgi:P-type Mg2+ transporter
VAIGAYLPYSPLAHVLGFTPLPVAFFDFLVGMIPLYLILVEIGKVIFYRHVPEGQPVAARIPHKRAHHRASRWSVRGAVLTDRRRARARHPSADAPASSPAR